MSRYELNGKVVLITGGAQGIGLAMAHAFRARGAQPVLLDLDAGGLGAAARQFGAAAPLTIPGDVTDPEAMRAAVATVTERLGGLDVVVANAGIAPAPAPLRRMPVGEFERVVDVNLLGVYRTVQPALEPIIARRGHVVVVASVYAFMNGAMASPYAVAKAGVEQLGRALRTELAQHEVGVTVAYFGFVDTEMVRQSIDRTDSGTEMEHALPAFVMRRITPEQAAEAVTRAVQARRARVIAPRWWTLASTLRGVLNPAFDYLSTRSERIQAVLRDADRV